MDETDSGRLSRRRLLGIGAACLAGASAGCVSTLPPLGSQVEIGRVDSPGTIGGPTYRQWVPAPPDYPESEFRGSPTVVVPTAFEDERAVRQGSIAYSITLSFVDYLGHDFVANDLAVGLEGTLAIEGPFDREKMATFLADTGYNPAGTVGTADIYTRPDGNRTLAIADGLAIQGSGEGSRRNVEYHLGTGRGNHERFHETRPDWTTFTDRVGLSPSIMFGWNPLATAGDPVYSSLSLRYDDQAVYHIGHSRYADDDAVPREKIREKMLEVTDQQRGRMELTVDGPTATSEFRISRSDEAYDTPVRAQPHVMWGWETDPEARTITLRHEAGDSFPAQYATIEAADPTDRQFVDEHETVGPGDSITVTVPTGADGVRVIYTLGEDSTVSLLSADLEEAP